MPKGPKGEKRPADVIGAAVMVARIATGEIEDATSNSPNRARGGKAGATLPGNAGTKAEPQRPGRVPDERGKPE